MRTGVYAIIAALVVLLVGVFALQSGTFAGKSAVTPTPVVAVSPTPVPTQAPTATPTPEPTATPTVAPTPTPIPTATPPQTVPVTVKVVDARTGAPLAGVQVVVSKAAFGCPFSGGAVLTTGTDGSFKFDSSPASYYFMLTTPYVHTYYKQATTCADATVVEVNHDPVTLVFPAQHM